jgi:hypothetical protein
MLFRLFLAFVLLVGSSALLPAQNFSRRAIQQQQQQQQFGRQQLPAQPVEIHGVIESATRGGILVSVDGANQRLHVAIPTTAKVEVSGKATADFLKAGQIVRFEAEIENHLIKGKVGELSVVGQSPETQRGIFPAGGALDDGSKPAKAAAAAAKALANGTYQIVGKLAVSRGGSGKFTVLAGRKKLPFELEDDATVAIESTDCSLAAAGDKVTAKVVMMPTRSGLMAHALEVKIELAERLAGAKKGPAPKHPAKPAKKDEGLPEPAADK